MLADRTVGSFRRPGELRVIETKTDGGAPVREYRGDPANWMTPFMAPRQMVAAFPGDTRVGWR